MPGLNVSGAPDGYPSREEFAAYLSDYASHFDLPVSLGDGVRLLARADDGSFSATLDSGEELSATLVIVATGPFQKPVIPTIGRKLDASILQLTAETYHQPRQIPAGVVLVVGDGATGRISRQSFPRPTRFCSQPGGRGGCCPSAFLGQACGGGCGPAAS
ncbi:NAD(P)-binding domain-containing protein [Aminobacter niigataensis]|uniref:NAD(P)-binding domain-containing protein n=1 Tax=Aminobacter niigataensis TaxID=83265 RepID=UPI001605EADA